MESRRILISLLIVYTVVNTSKSEPNDNDNDNDNHDVEKRQPGRLVKLAKAIGHGALHGALIGGVSPFVDPRPFGGTGDLPGHKFDTKNWKKTAKIVGNGATKGAILGGLTGGVTRFKPLGKREQEAMEQEMQRRGWLGSAAKLAANAIGKREEDAMKQEMQRRGWLGSAAKLAANALGKREEEAMKQEMQRRGWLGNLAKGAGKAALGFIGKREEEADDGADGEEEEASAR